MPAMVELVGICGYYAMISMTLNVFRAQLPEDATAPFAEPASGPERGSLRYCIRPRSVSTICGTGTGTASTGSGVRSRRRTCLGACSSQ